MLVPTSGIEPLASPLPRECSTPELRGQLSVLYTLSHLVSSPLLFLTQGKRDHRDHPVMAVHLLRVAGVWRGHQRHPGDMGDDVLLRHIDPASLPDSPPV